MHLVIIWVLSYKHRVLYRMFVDFMHTGFSKFISCWRHATLRGICNIPDTQKDHEFTSLANTFSIKMSSASTTWHDETKRQPLLIFVKYSHKFGRNSGAVYFFFWIVEWKSTQVARRLKLHTLDCIPSIKSTRNGIKHLTFYPYYCVGSGVCRCIWRSYLTVMRFQLMFKDSFVYCPRFFLQLILHAACVAC